MHVSHGGFPRSRDRGPIEASNSRLVRWASWYFRDHVIAAPLTPAVPLHPFVRAVDFRDHVIAAPLKRDAASVVVALLFDFRDHVIAAPLKRPLRFDARLRKVRFPRSRDRGPIEAASATRSCR